jgi:hypothetical protein
MVTVGGKEWSWNKMQFLFCGWMDVELAIYQLRSLSYDGDVYVILITGV